MTDSHSLQVAIGLAAKRARIELMARACAPLRPNSSMERMMDNVTEATSFIEELAKAALEKSGTEKKLSRHEAAGFLTLLGYPTAPAQLATLASKGGGPPYQKWGRVVIYSPSELRAWAEARRSMPRRSTSEADALRIVRRPLTTCIGRSSHDRRS